MRLKLFEWTEKTFGHLSPGSLINYKEMINENLGKIKDKTGKEEIVIFRFNEIAMAIKMADAPKEFLNSEIHIKWKKEIEQIMSPEGFDRLGFDVSSEGFKNTTPNDVEIIKGIPEGALLRKHPLSITLTFFKKRLLIKNPQEK